MNVRSARIALVAGVLALAVGCAPSAVSLRPDPLKPTDSPKASYTLLTEGNGRFAPGNASHPDQSTDIRAVLANGQKPHTIVLSCSDSRTSPELVFDQGLGDVFVIRVAGNVFAANELASIEYAVEHLGANLIVVMGHDSCGAVKATLTTPEDQSAGSPSLDTLVGEIRQNLANAKLTDADRADPKLDKAVRANVNAVTQQLGERSELLRKAVADHKVAIISAKYALDTGKVEFWNISGLSGSPGTPQVP